MIPMKPLTLRFSRLACIVIIAAFLYQCKKDFFPQKYHDIYGNWTIRNISGGLFPTSIKPTFDILTIDHNMRFATYRNDTLISKGNIVIVSETADYLKIDFVSKNNPIGSPGGDQIVRVSHDTLILSDDCADCFSSFFVRSEVYLNENYTQSDKRLDFIDLTYYPIGMNKSFTSIFFQNEALGFISCSDGSILKTSNGGKNWKIMQTNNTLPLYGISFVSNDIGFAVGGTSYCGGTGCIVPGYIMLKTIDGGETWEKVSLPYKQADLKTIKFYGSSFGIALGTGARLITRNGGQTWENITWENMTAVYHIFFLNDNVAFLSGIMGQLFKTTDRGETWQNLSLKNNSEINNVMFINEQIGFISQYNSLMKSIDGGLTWSRIEYAPIGIYAMYFTSETNAVVFGARSFASSKWDVWDSLINVLIDGKWYGDERIGPHSDLFFLNPKLVYTITNESELLIIRLTN